MNRTTSNSLIAPGGARIRRTARSAGAAALLLALLAPQAHGQDYPAKPIRIVLPFAAGGGTDVLARILAQRFTDSHDAKLFAFRTDQSHLGRRNFAVDARLLLFCRDELSPIQGPTPCVAANRPNQKQIRRGKIPNALFDRAYWRASVSAFRRAMKSSKPSCPRS